MQIQINTDRNLAGREQLGEYVRGVVQHAVNHFSERITRVQVHLGDENGAKSGPDDKRCVMEVRVERRQPIAVRHHAATLDAAVDGAAGKLRRSLAHDSGRQRARR